MRDFAVLYLRGCIEDHCTEEQMQLRFRKGRAELLLKEISEAAVSLAEAARMSCLGQFNSHARYGTHHPCFCRARWEFLILHLQTGIQFFGCVRQASARHAKHQSVENWFQSDLLPPAPRPQDPNIRKYLEEAAFSGRSGHKTVLSSQRSM